MNVDPRLRSFAYNSPDFGFPSHPASAQFDPNINPYALPLDQQHGLPPTASPRRSAAGHAQQQSPHTRLRNSQPSSVNQNLSSPPGPSPAHRRQTPNNTNTNSVTTNQSRNAKNLVWKNSTTAYPDGVTISEDPNIFSLSSLPPQPPSNLHNNTNADYFSSQQLQTLPDADEGPPTPAPEVVATGDSANPFSSTFPLVTDPPDLGLWRTRLFDIPTPIHLTEAEFLTYFPHIDNVYSHRSTQKYKRKPFVSHYWDCRLKGRPSGTKKSDDPNIKRRKREKRERDLCDVKVKVTEWFSREEAGAIGLSAVALGEGEAAFDFHNGGLVNGLQVVMDERSVGEDGMSSGGGGGVAGSKWPRGHPGADGKKWYTIQRVNGSVNAGGKKGDEQQDDMDNDDTMGDGRNLDHKHSLEHSDRIKKNSVHRWLLKEEKEKRASKKSKIDPTLNLDNQSFNLTGSTSAAMRSASSLYLASGPASSTIRQHRSPQNTHLTFFANAYCPFAQRVWIALELKGIRYQFVEITPDMAADVNPSAASLTQGGLKMGTTQNQIHNPIVDSGIGGLGSGVPKSFKSRAPKDLLEVNPEANIPCIKHGNWGIWESNVMMEYLEDLSLVDENMGVPLWPVGQPQLKAHCRLWVDHVNRKVLPAFYALLLTPPPRARSATAESHGSMSTGGVNNDREEDPLATRHNILITTLQTAITKLVNASHAVGPFFLGPSISYVDVACAPWIIRLSRVLSYYRNFPRPEIGTRWQSWVDAIEADDRVQRTISEERSYHGVYRGVGEDGIGVLAKRADGGKESVADQMSGRKKAMVEIEYAKSIMGQEGFGLGGDLYGHMGLDPAGDGGIR